MTKKELPQFLSDQKLLIVSWKFKCISEITIQVPKTPTKKLFSPYFTKKSVHHSLSLAVIQNLG